MKKLLSNISNRFFYGKYKSELNYTNTITTKKEYIVKFICSFFFTSCCFYLLFDNFIYSIPLGFIASVFYINQIFLNNKVLHYENYLINQFSVYTSQTAMLMNFNNIYHSLKLVLEYIDEPLKTDLAVVIDNLGNKKSMDDAFAPFNKKYNNKILNLFNQTLCLFAENGDSDANTVLHSINEEMNNLRIQKDRYLKFKKNWRHSYYVVVAMSFFLPLLLKWVVPIIYMDFIHSWGSILLSIIVILNILISSKVEARYRDQNIGESGKA